MSTPRHHQKLARASTMATKVLIVFVLTTLVAIAAAPLATAADRAQEYMERGHLAMDAERYRQAADAFRQAANRAQESELRAEALYWRAFALQRQGGKEELRQAAEALVALKHEEYAEQLARESRALAAQVRAELARQGDAQAARELAEMLEEQEDLELKLMALQGMMNMNPERARPILIEVLQNREPGTAELRQQAIFLLVQGQSEGVEDIMIDIVHNDPDAEVRQQAVFWLSQVGSERAFEILVDLIVHGEDPEVQSQAIFAVAHHGGEKAGPVLRQVAEDPTQDRENREAAIFWLGHEGGEEHLVFLKDLYAELDEPQLRENVLYSVAQSGAEGVSEWLVEIALNENESLDARKTALFWAGQQGHLPLDRLDVIYKQVDDVEMREQIIFVLSQDGSDEALEMLMNIAREETDIELRKNAVFWIGQTGGEQAEAFLLEIITDGGGN